MKQFSKILAAVCLFICAFCISAYAKNNVSDIDISVSLQSDGSAYITQIWNGSFNEGTENYIPINTNGIEISGYKVSDQTGDYTSVQNWNINAGFDEKSRKYGVNTTPDGVELCFGISEYGANTYKIEYIVHDFIKAYTDYDGTNFMLINPNMSTFPTNAKISISLADGSALNENNAGIWGFGYHGQINFAGGKVIAYTEEALSGSSSMIVMLRLEKGILSPNSYVDNSFDTVKDRAFSGSSYENASNGWFEIFIAVCVILVIAAVIFLILFAIIHAIKRRLDIKRFYKDADYFRDIPNGGDIALSYYLAKNFDICNQSEFIIGAELLTMINNHSIEPLSEEKNRLFGKPKTSLSLRLIEPPKDTFQLKLYNILTNSAGDDQILQEHELERYIASHPACLSKFCDNICSRGERAFFKLGGYSKKSVNCIKYLSERGTQELGEIMGLKKFLLDFSLISEREVTESEIWKDYLVYATLFGIADKVIEQFKKVYPNQTIQIREYDRNIIFAMHYYNTIYRSMLRTSAQQTSSARGFGGSSSFGGGGGFSGGGFGGGSR